jgi:hypothetical protein
MSERGLGPTRRLSMIFRQERAERHTVTSALALPSLPTTVPYSGGSAANVQAWSAGCAEEARGLSPAEEVGKRLACDLATL